jgi:Major Facilitator Superfamily
MSSIRGSMPREAEQSVNRAALRFVVLIGVVSLFADMAYEGARSITGPYLAVLGASATAVGVVAGVGELLGYGLRLFSGRLSDRMRAYWPITIAGYLIQMIAVPALALAGNWPVAAVLIVAERIGKATRNPPRDAMLARASRTIGRGWAFGIHEALDQAGAFIGPLVCAVVLARTGRYPAAFGILLVPAVLTLGTLGLARVAYPPPPLWQPDSRISRSLPITFRRPGSSSRPSCRSSMPWRWAPGVLRPWSSDGCTTEPASAC